jgi:hypothetical protein
LFPGDSGVNVGEKMAMVGEGTNPELPYKSTYQTDIKDWYRAVFSKLW